MHRSRLVIALLLLPILYAYVMYLPPTWFFFLILAASTVALGEFYAMARIKGILKYSGFLWGGVLLTTFFSGRGHFHGFVVLSVLSTISLRLFSRRDPSAALPEVSAAVFGLFYIPVLLSVQLDLVREGPAWIVFLYAAVWAADSMAYYVGKGIGKRKLFESVSPNKTVAGAVGSAVGGGLGALLVKVLHLPQVTVAHAMFLGAAVGVSTIVGDLAESMFKRDAGVKDSGALMPGHGGILDKIDGVTFAGPVFYWLCSFSGLFR